MTGRSLAVWSSAMAAVQFESDTMFILDAVSDFVYPAWMEHDSALKQDEHLWPERNRR